MLRALFLLLCLNTLPLGANAAGLSAVTLTHDGQSRSYRLYVPDTLHRFPGPRPLVLVLHGGGGSSREVHYSTRGRFDALAEEHGFLVVYPDAIRRVWDTGSGDISEGLRPRRDDDGFLKAVIAEISDRFQVDQSRIFATGVSRGGMESFALACANPGLIRAIAPVAMTLPAASSRACGSGAPLGFALFHGTADPFVPYDGGPINIGIRDRDVVLSAEQTMTIFTRRNGCDSRTTRHKGSVSIHNYTGCAVPTAFYSIKGGGHGWPGGIRARKQSHGGAITGDISSPDEIWTFFSRF